MSNDYLLELGFLVQEPDDDVCRSVSGSQINEGGGDIFIEGDLLPIQRDGETEVKTIAWPKEVIFDENFFRSIYAGDEPITSATEYIEFQDGNKSFRVNFGGQSSWTIQSPASCANIGINLTPGRSYVSLINNTGALSGSSSRLGTTEFYVEMHGVRILRGERYYNLENNKVTHQVAYGFAWPSNAQVPPLQFQPTKYRYSPANKSSFSDQICNPEFYDVGESSQVTVHIVAALKLKEEFDKGTFNAGDVVISNTFSQSDGAAQEENYIFRVIDASSYEVYDKNGNSTTIEWEDYRTEILINEDYGRANLVDALKNAPDFENTPDVTRHTYWEFSTDYTPPVPPVPLDELILDSDLVPCAVIADGAAKTIEGSEFKKLFFDLSDWTVLPGGVKIINGGRNCEITKTAGGPNNWDPFVKIVIEDEWLDDDYIYSMCPPAMSGSEGGGIDMLDKGRSYASAEFGFQATTGKITVNDKSGRFGSQWRTHSDEDQSRVDLYVHYNWRTAEEMRNSTFGFRWQVDNRATRQEANFDLATINPYILRMPAALYHQYDDYAKVNEFFGEELLNSSGGFETEFDQQPLADQSIPEGTVVYNEDTYNICNIKVYIRNGESQKRYRVINFVTQSSIISADNTYYVKNFKKQPTPEEAQVVENCYPAGELVDWHFEVI